MDILLLLVGLGLILGGANFLTDGSAAVAQRFRVPEFIIGLTIVAVGTSMPELVVSVLSAAAGNSDVAIGNVVGSNIFNVFVILGICALIRPLVLTKENIRRDIPFGMAASLVLLAVTSDRLVCAGATDRIGRPDGIVMLALYIGLMWYMIRTTKRQRSIPGATTGMNVPVSGAALKNGAQHAEGTKKPIALWLAGVMIAGGRSPARSESANRSSPSRSWRAARRCRNWLRRWYRCSKAKQKWHSATSSDRTSPTSC